MTANILIPIITLFLFVTSVHSAIVTSVTKAGGKDVVTFTSDTNHYYVGVHRQSLMDIGTYVTVVTGDNNTSYFEVPSSASSKAYYHVVEIPVTNALDTDSDGIDDVIELTDGVNPLVPSTACSNLSYTLPEDTHAFYDAFRDDIHDKDMYSEDEVAAIICEGMALNDPVINKYVAYALWSETLAGIYDQGGREIDNILDVRSFLADHDTNALAMLNNLPDLKEDQENAVNDAIIDFSPPPLSSQNYSGKDNQYYVPPGIRGWSCEDVVDHMKSMDIKWYGGGADFVYDIPELGDCYCDIKFTISAEVPRSTGDNHIFSYSNEGGPQYAYKSAHIGSEDNRWYWPTNHFSTCDLVDIETDVVARFFKRSHRFYLRYSMDRGAGCIPYKPLARVTNIELSHKEPIKYEIGTCSRNLGGWTTPDYLGDYKVPSWLRSGINALVFDHNDIHLEASCEGNVLHDRSFGFYATDFSEAASEWFFKYLPGPNPLAGWVDGNVMETDVSNSECNMKGVSRKRYVDLYRDAYQYYFKRDMRYHLTTYNCIIWADHMTKD